MSSFDALPKTTTASIYTQTASTFDDYGAPIWSETYAGSYTGFFQIPATRADSSSGLSQNSSGYYPSYDAQFFARSTAAQLDEDSIILKDGFRYRVTAVNPVYDGATFDHYEYQLKREEGTR